MQLWHLTPDAPRTPYQVIPGVRVTLQFGTWPIEPDQAVEVVYWIEHTDGTIQEEQKSAIWRYNEHNNSYWQVEIGPFTWGDKVTYSAYSPGVNANVTTPKSMFKVGPKLYLAILWHQHQPIYKNTAHSTQAGSYLQPWVRLHAIRDYYSMTALVAEHPDLHLTINLTQSLWWQIEDYLERDATDHALDLTLKPADTLTSDEREYILSEFFDAHWHNQIFPHPRYNELFVQRREGRQFSGQELRDLQMWFNLAWFGQEFRTGEVLLATGEVASVRRFVEQERHFSQADVEAMVAEQYKIMRAIIPIHRQLQDQGQIEVSTTPFYHPILPLLVDSDRATIDRPGATYPTRFNRPVDAEAQVRLAIEHYQHCFGRKPRGMWPAEGAVSQFVLPFFAQQGVRWIASDHGVLARSGRWGYRTDDPDVLCQPYRAVEGNAAISIFFRDTALSDAIGFRYYSYSDYEQAAFDFIREVKERFAWRVTGDEDRLLTVVLDGENAWGAYREDARPFLHALYTLLERDVEIQTVTFSEYLDGNAVRSVAPHPLAEQTQVYDLFTGSWIDEYGSQPGVDLGTWIGEEEENRAWTLLGQARQAIDQAGATPESAPEAFTALYMAEGSDWFWWFGSDQDSGNDGEFDDLFRLHLKNVYRGLGIEPPRELERNIVPHVEVWTFTRPIAKIQAADRLTVRTNCQGILTWQTDGSTPKSAALMAAGGVMAGIRHYYLTLDSFAAEDKAVRFSFRCTTPNCDGTNVCCQQEEHTVQIV